MGDYDRLGDAITGAIWTLFVSLLIAVPLAIWKLIEIIIWCCHHIHIAIK